MRFGTHARGPSRSRRGAWLLLAVLAGLPAAARWSTVRADGWHAPPFESSPLDFWRRNRERLGFSPGANVPDPKAGPAEKPKELEDLDAAKRQREDLLERRKTATDPAQRTALDRELAALNAAITAYGVTDGGKRPGQERRRAFIHQLVISAAFINPENLTVAEYGWILQNRRLVMDEIVQILAEIGPEAVPQLWEHLRDEIVFYGPGKRDKGAAAKELKRLQAELEALRVQQRAAPDKATWEALERRGQTLQAELEQVQALAEGRSVEPPPAGQQGAPLAGVRGTNSLVRRATGSTPGKVMDGTTGAETQTNLTVAADFIETLTRALVAIGAKGMADWLPGLWDPNASVREQARKLAKGIGAPAVPVLIAALRNQSAPSHRAHLTLALKEVTGQELEASAEKWEEWLRVQAAQPPMIAPAPPVAPQPPTPAGEAGGIEIGPRK